MGHQSHSLSRLTTPPAGSRNPQRGAATLPVGNPLLSPLSIENNCGLKLPVFPKHCHKVKYSKVLSHSQTVMESSKQYFIQFQSGLWNYPENCRITLSRRNTDEIDDE